MAHQLTVDTSKPKAAWRFYPALIVLAVLACIAAALAVSGRSDAPARAAGAAAADSAIQVPRMQNVPPPDQKMKLEVEKR